MLSPVFGLISRGREREKGSPLAENSAGVRMRAAGLSIHLSTFPYVQHMNYRFPMRVAGEVDALFTSHSCLQTKVGKKGEES